MSKNNQYTQVSVKVSNFIDSCFVLGEMARYEWSNTECTNRKMLLKITSRLPLTQCSCTGPSHLVPTYNVLFLLRTTKEYIEASIFVGITNLPCISIYSKYLSRKIKFLVSPLNTTVLVVFDKNHSILRVSYGILHGCTLIPYNVLLDILTLALLVLALPLESTKILFFVRMTRRNMFFIVSITIITYST